LQSNSDENYFALSGLWVCHFNR